MSANLKLTAKTLASMPMPSVKGTATMAKFQKMNGAKVQQPASIASEKYWLGAANLQKEETYPSLELITYEQQDTAGGNKLPEGKEELQLELIHEEQLPSLNAVDEQVRLLQEQFSQMETREGGLELLRGSLGLQKAQLEAIQRREEHKSSIQGVQLLRASSGLQQKQLDAIRKHSQESVHVGGLNQTKLTAKATSARLTLLSKTLTSKVPMPSAKGAAAMAKFQKLKGRAKLQESARSISNASAIGAVAKLVQKEETYPSLELITYEQQDTAGGNKLPEGKEELQLELIHEEQRPSLNAVDEQVRLLQEQFSQMETQGGGLELLRGSLGLQKAQVEAIRMHEERKRSTQGAEILRASSGLQQKQLDAIRKHSQPAQGYKQGLTAEVASSNPRPKL